MHPIEFPNSLPPSANQQKQNNMSSCNVFTTQSTNTNNNPPTNPCPCSMTRAGPSTGPRFFPPPPNHYSPSSFNTPNDSTPACTIAVTLQPNGFRVSAGAVEYNINGRILNIDFQAPCAQGIAVNYVPFVPTPQFSNVPRIPAVPSAPHSVLPPCCLRHPNHRCSPHAHATPHNVSSPCVRRAPFHDHGAQHFGGTDSGDVHRAVESQSSLQTLQEPDPNNNTMKSPQLAYPPSAPSLSEDDFTDDEADDVPGLYRVIYRRKSGKKVWECTFVTPPSDSASPLQRICGAHMCGIKARMDHVNSHVVDETLLLANNVIRAEEVIAYHHRVESCFTCPEPDCGYLMTRGKRFRAAGGADAQRRHNALYHPEIGGRAEKAKVKVEDVKEEDADD